jgi:hypothetical protein
LNLDPLFLALLDRFAVGALELDECIDCHDLTPVLLNSPVGQRGLRSLFRR